MLRTLLFYVTNELLKISKVFLSSEFAKKSKLLKIGMSITGIF